MSVRFGRGPCWYEQKYEYRVHQRLALSLSNPSPFKAGELLGQSPRRRRSRQLRTIFRLLRPPLYFPNLRRSLKTGRLFVNIVATTVLEVDYPPPPRAAAAQTISLELSETLGNEEWGGNSNEPLSFPSCCTLEKRRLENSLLFVSFSEVTITKYGYYHKSKFRQRRNFSCSSSFLPYPLVFFWKRKKCWILLWSDSPAVFLPACVGAKHRSKLGKVPVFKQAIYFFLFTGRFRPATALPTVLRHPVHRPPLGAAAEVGGGRGGDGGHGRGGCRGGLRGGRCHCSRGRGGPVHGGGGGNSGGGSGERGRVSR